MAYNCSLRFEKGSQTQANGIGGLVVQLIGVDSPDIVGLGGNNMVILLMSSLTCSHMKFPHRHRHS